MEILPKDILFLIALELDLENITNLCLSCNKIKDKIFDNEIFWMKKNKKDYDININLFNKHYYLKIENLLRNAPNEAYKFGIEWKALSLIKLSVEKGADVNFIEKGKYYPLLRIILEDEIFDYLVDKVFKNREITIAVIKNFFNLMDEADTKEEKCNLFIKLYDKMLPLSVPYLFEKYYWKNVLLKFEEAFIVYNKIPGFQNFFYKKINFYRDLAKD